jgi:translation initiation factor IF-3
MYDVNEKITVERVLVINDDGSVGEMDTKEALTQAKEEGLDLVLVGPKATPPVAKILDYASLKYQKQKEAKKQKASQKVSQLKVLRLSPRIGQHDLDVRIKKAGQFLDKGDKVKIEILLKGREKAHADVAFEVINDFISSMQALREIKVEGRPTKQGSRIEAIFSNDAQ